MDYICRSVFEKEGGRASFRGGKKGGGWRFRYVDTGDKGVVVEIRRGEMVVKSSGQERVFLSSRGKKALVSRSGERLQGKIGVGDMVEIRSREGRPGVVKIYIETRQRTMKASTGRNGAIVGILVLVGLGLIIVWGHRKNEEKINEGKYTKGMGAVIEKLSGAEGVKTVDPEKALRLVSEADQLLKAVPTLSKYQKEIGEKNGEIRSLLDTLGAVGTERFELVYDTQLIEGKDKNYTKMAINGDNLYLLDPQNGRLDKINWKMKSTEKMGQTEGLKGILEVTTNGDKVVIFNGQEVMEVGISGIKEIAKVNEKNLIKVRGYGGSWYFLGNDGEIVKNTTKWISNGEKLVAGARDLAIDSRIWVANALGEIGVYEKGERLDWAVSVKNLGSDNIGILTEAKSQVVALVSDKVIRAFDKVTGELEESVNLEKIGVRDAVMATDGVTILVLGQNQKIYAVKLRGEVLQ